MNPRSPHAEFERARTAFHDSLLALELDDAVKLALTAAAQSLAKAQAVWALAQFIDRGQAALEHVG